MGRASVPAVPPAYVEYATSVHPADDCAALGVPEPERLLSNRLYRLVCSSPWEQHCREQVRVGLVRNKASEYGEESDRRSRLARNLRKAGVYPPGGLLTQMIRCAECGRWHPPQASREARDRTATPRDDGSVLVEYTPWRDVCGDCYYASLPLARIVHLPSVPLFYRIDSDELSAHLYGTGYQARARQRPPRPPGQEWDRRQRIDARGVVHCEEAGEDGFVRESLYVLELVGPEGDANETGAR